MKQFLMELNSKFTFPSLPLKFKKKIVKLLIVLLSLLYVSGLASEGLLWGITNGNYVYLIAIIELCYIQYLNDKLPKR